MFMEVQVLRTRYQDPLLWNKERVRSCSQKPGVCEDAIWLNEPHRKAMRQDGRKSAEKFQNSKQRNHFPAPSRLHSWALMHPSIDSSRSQTVRIKGVSNRYRNGNVNGTAPSVFSVCSCHFLLPLPRATALAVLRPILSF